MINIDIHSISIWKKRPIWYYESNLKLSSLHLSLSLTLHLTNDWKHAVLKAKLCLDSKWLHHFNAWLVPYCLSHARAKRTLQASSSGWIVEKRGEIIKKEGGRKNAMPGLFSFVFRKWSTIHFAAKVLKSLASVKKGCCLRERESWPSNWR